MLRRSWTFDEVKEEALRYDNKKDFRENSSAYSVALRKGWIDSVCSHMNKLGNLYKRQIYKALFSDNSIYIGITYDIKKRTKEHLTNPKSSIFRHMIKTGLVPNFTLISDDFLDIDKAIEIECNLIKEYIDRGFNVLNSSKGGELGSSNIIWTYETIRDEALKYKTRGEFQNKSGRAYAVAIKNGWLDSFCKHMIEAKHPNGYWTFDRTREEALKYNNKSDFSKNSNKAYNAAKRNGWLLDICAHMNDGKKPNGYWTLDNVRIEALKYKSRSEFKRNSASAYSYALKNNWLDLFF